MGKIRSIHPDACESHTLAGLTDQAERTWWRLLPNTDDHGRGRYDPVTLRSKLYMANPDVTVGRVTDDLDELHRAGLITVYRHDGRIYYLVRSWGEYQRPKHQAESRHPDPDDPKSETVDPEPDPAGEDSDPIEPTEREGELGVGSWESSLSDPDGVGTNGQSAESGADDADSTASTDVSPQGMTVDEAFEKWWAAYPQRNGKKVGKGNARAEFKKLTWEQRRRAYWGAVNLAKSDTLPKDPERFLRKSSKSGEFPFDDWQQPDDPSVNGHGQRLTGLAEVF